MSEDQVPKKVKLTGLWKQQSKSGDVYYSGSLTYSTNLLMFKNKFKKSDRDPDLILYISEKKKKEKDDEGD